jgi:hypothetical protein
MAKCTLGPLIAQISGSLGGMTFRNDPSGLVLQPRCLPTRKYSPAQLLHRGYLAASATAWSDLDYDIKRAWNTLARQERIPDTFARGRKWTGRQLFTCFYLYAQHQYTPLPARWLPKSPIFHSSMTLQLFFFDAYTPLGGSLTTGNLIYTAYPGSLSPYDPAESLTNHCAAVWLGFRRMDSQSPPRQYVKVAPLPLSWAYSGVPPTNYNNGYGYFGWGNLYKRLFGQPLGLPEGQYLGITPTFAISAFSVTITDERLYFSQVLAGSTRVSNIGYAQDSDGMNDINTGASPLITRVLPLNIPTTEY